MNLDHAVRWVAPSAVDQGMRVLVPVGDGRGGAWCTVVCAAGVSGRCVNERLGIDSWYRLDEMRVAASAKPGGKQ